MIQHTCGPWRLHEDGIRVFAETGLVATAEPFGVLTGTERNANAWLMAAAPELLAAAVGAAGCIHGEFGSMPHDLRQAITKATGNEDWLETL